MEQPDRDPRVWLQVFGCQMNKLDAELVKSLLHSGGYSFAEEPDKADVVFMLTCSVREHAESRVHSRLGMLKKWKASKENSILGILGCMAQKEGEKLIKQHPHVDLVVGTRDFPHILEFLERIRSGERGIVALNRKDTPRVSRNERLRPHRFKAYLSIMRGCNSYCSYCVVPSVRGNEESRSMGHVLQEAQRLLEDGVIEITLLGQTVNRYRDEKGNRLSHLLRHMDALPGLMRLNFVTSYPVYMDDVLIQAMADCQKVSRFLHLPAQSGSDRILAKMKRNYTADFYRAVVSKLRNAVPDMELGSDFIVGFPGETEEDFQATKQLMEEVRFQQSFIFKYSTRPGTSAALRFEDDVPHAIKRERNAQLLALQERISREKNRGLEGSEVEVLVEGVSPRDPNRYTGRTIYNQIVAFPGSPEWIGQRVRVHVERTTPLTLLGDKVVEVLK